MGVIDGETPLIEATDAEVNGASDAYAAAQAEREAMQVRWEEAERIHHEHRIELAQAEARVSAVEAAIDRAADGLVTGRVIAQLHDEVATNLVRELGFMSRVVRRPSERGA